jgi:Asp-tRNA(Asn)/Glu-tRNA(Gln) amidotransferase C subunit
LIPGGEIEILCRELASIMIMFGFVERVDCRIIGADMTNMIAHNVDHDPNIAFMSLVDELLQVLLGAEMRVDIVKVRGPVSMITVLLILNDWGNPDGVESKI